MSRFAGRHALVTGGTTGIGHEVSLGFAKAGATVVASSRRQDVVDSTAAELEALGSKTLRLASDVTDRAGLEKLRDETIAAFGKIDILFVTAGMWAMAMEFRRDSTLPLQRTEDWTQDILSADEPGNFTPPASSVPDTARMRDTSRDTTKKRP